MVKDLKSRFRGKDYHQVRPTYPASLFSVVKSALQPAKKHQPLRVLDLGAGTGLASHSFLNVYPHAQITLVEPDPGMLEQAHHSLPQAKHVLSRAEVLPFQGEEFDLVLVGSAWHWMDYSKTMDEVARVLCPDGAAFIFEYQFPKAKDAPELNEWVRRQFNLYWKAPSQVPRGSLYEITQGFRDHQVFSQMAQIQMDEVREHSADEFAEVIFSQSRFLHFEETLEESSEKYRLKVQNEIQSHWKERETLPFLYCYEGFAFQKRP